MNYDDDPRFYPSIEPTPLGALLIILAALAVCIGCGVLAALQL